METIVIAVLLGGLASTVGWAWAVEAARCKTLQTQLAAADDRRRRDNHIIRHLSDENKQLWRDLADMQLQRDIRPPADPIAQFLADNGTTELAVLVARYGRDVNRKLHILRNNGYVDADPTLLYWYACSPIEQAATQTRVVPAMQP